MPTSHLISSPPPCSAHPWRFHTDHTDPSESAPPYLCQTYPAHVPLLVPVNRSISSPTPSFSKVTSDLLFMFSLLLFRLFPLLLSFYLTPVF